MEPAERARVPGQLALALQDVHLDARLVVRRGRENLALARRNRGVTLDELGHDAAQSLDTQRQRRDVEEKQILDLAAQHARLHGRADRHDLVRVHTLVGLAAEELAHQLLDLGDARAAPDQDHLVDVGRLHARVLESLLHGREGAFKQVAGQPLKLSPAQFHLEMLGTRGVGRDEG